MFCIPQIFRNGKHFKLLGTIGKEIIFLGDTNGDLLSDRIHMKELYDSFGLKKLIDKPARETIKTKTLIDHAATTQPGNIVELGIFKVCVSASILCA